MNKYPKFHFSENSGWINDPNGCIFHNGEYHLFYQFNPHDTKWGPMHWGHAITKDFINWEYQPIALTPDQEYENHDGCFSGSAVVKDGKIHLIYTATKNFDDDYDQTQCLAIETDSGFEKSPLNPLICRTEENMSRDFRDPKVIYHNDKYYMVLGNSTIGARENGDGEVLLYESKDLTNWAYKGVLFKSNGQYGTMFECPDLIKIENEWVLIFSPMFYDDNKSTYIIGDCDLANCNFTPKYSSEIDFGTDFYAPQSFFGCSKPTIIAWQNGWEWMPWFEGFGKADVYCGSMSMARELSIVDGKLLSKPLESYDKYFSLINEECTKEILNASEVSKFTCNEIKKGDTLELHFGNESVSIEFSEDKIAFDRSNLKDYYSNVKISEYNLKQVNKLEVYIDNNSIELFVNDGEFSMSNLVFPNQEISRITTNRELELSLYSFNQGE